MKYVHYQSLKFIPTNLYMPNETGRSNVSTSKIMHKIKIMHMFQSAHVLSTKETLGRFSILIFGCTSINLVNNYYNYQRLRKESMILSHFLNRAVKTHVYRHLFGLDLKFRMIFFTLSTSIIALVNNGHHT